jgi:hypothetical protein
MPNSLKSVIETVENGFRAVKYDSYQKISYCNIEKQKLTEVRDYLTSIKTDLENARMGKELKLSWKGFGEVEGMFTFYNSVIKNVRTFN